MFFKKLSRNSFLKNSKQIPNLLKQQKCFKHDAVINLSFRVSQKDSFLEKLKSVGTLVQEAQFEDTYFDSTETSLKEEPYTLSKGDVWLRKRSGGWECKSPLVSEGLTHVGKDRDFYIPTYSKLFGEKDIRRELNLQKDFNQSKTTLEEDLEEKGIVPFAKFKANLYTFSLGPNVSLDVETSDFGYGCGFLKVNVPNAHEDAIEESHDMIQKYVETLELEVVPNTHDLIAEYIHKNDPKHFKALLEAKVFNDKRDDEKKYAKLKKSLTKDEEKTEE